MLTTWSIGDANLILNVEKYPDTHFLAIPTDFEIRILGLNADTSYSPISRYATPVNFQVWNVTDSIKMEFIFNEYGIPDGKITANERIIIITNRDNRRYNSSWTINFYQPHLIDPILPESGDVAFITIAKPFTEQDIFRFRTLPNYVSIDDKANNFFSKLFKLGQNYPNPFNTNTTIEYCLVKRSKVYIDIYDEKKAFLKELGKSGYSGGELTPKSNALYYFKKAMKYRDGEAAEKYLKEYVSFGGNLRGLKKSLTTLHPLNGLNAVEKMGFVSYLDDKGREKLKTAIKFYEDQLK